MKFRTTSSCLQETQQATQMGGDGHVRTEAYEREPHMPVHWQLGEARSSPKVLEETGTCWNSDFKLLVPE